MISAQGMDIGGAGVGHDPSADSGAAHLAVSRLTIGSWNLVSKHDEHILLSFYWGERKLVWEVLHAGVVRKMEVGFEDVVEAALSSSGPEDPERLVLELARPPRFFKEQMTVAGGAKQANYVYTTDFTSGQASQVSRHILYFAAGMASGQAEAMRAHGLPVRSEGASRGGDLMGSSALLGGSGGGAKATGHASSAALRQPPTSSPRLDAIILQEQLDREMRERQARYSGICSVRESIFGTAFNELFGAVARNESKRGKTLQFVRDEASMSIDAYKAVFESSITFGVRKLNQAVETKGDLEEQITLLETEIDARKAEVSDLTALCVSLEHREELRNKTYDVRSKELTDLSAEKLQLEALLETLRKSKPEPKGDAKK